MRRCSSLVMLAVLVLCASNAATAADVIVKVKVPVDYTVTSHEDSGAKRVAISNGGAAIDVYNFNLGDEFTVTKDPTLPAAQTKVCNNQLSGNITVTFHNCLMGGCDCYIHTDVVTVTLAPGQCTTINRDCSVIDDD